MKFFDLHCDTLYRSLQENKNLFDNDFHISLERGLNFDFWMECFAVWVSDDLSGSEALDFFNKSLERFREQQTIYSNYMEQIRDLKNTFGQNNKCGGILAVEGSKALNGDLNNIEYFKNCGVKYITLTWNGDCDIGSGCGVKNPNGLTGFGKEAIKLMNEYSIIPDVSHASDKLFYDVVKSSKKPVIATHSNSRAVCVHRRNLTDEQFEIIKSMGGIVGINFCRDFLCEDGFADLSDIRRHVDHFLGLSGEKTLCIGSDFDGTDMPEGIVGIESIHSLYDYFLDCGYSESLLEDIFFNNAYNFFKNY